MEFNLTEDNKNVDNAISHLESLVVDLRRKGKLNQHTLDLLQNLFDEEINYYMTNYYIPDVEINSKYEENIINEIMDVISILYKII
jgi:hypothetical protein